jgi:PAS domain-containing protein
VLGRQVQTQLELRRSLAELRSKSDQALHESADRLSLVLDAAELGTWDWSLSTGDLYWSPRCRALFDLEPGAAVTTPEPG